MNNSDFEKIGLLFESIVEVYGLHSLSVDSPAPTQQVIQHIQERYEKPSANMPEKEVTKKKKRKFLV